MEKTRLNTKSKKKGARKGEAMAHEGGLGQHRKGRQPLRRFTGKEKQKGPKRGGGGGWAYSSKPPRGP